MDKDMRPLSRDVLQWPAGSALGGGAATEHQIWQRIPVHPSSLAAILYNHPGPPLDVVSAHEDQSAELPRHPNPGRGRPHAGSLPA